MASHARLRVTACIDCGKAGTPGNGLSYRGLCEDCAIERHAAQVRQMAEKRGPAFEAWQESMLDCARKILQEQNRTTTAG